MKKFLSLLTAFMMLLGCLPAAAGAEAFPELDPIAAWDYVGDWFGVSGLDVMGDPTAEYPDLKLCLYLNGLGDLYLDGGDKEVVGWYIEDGNVFLARTADNVPNADEIFAYAYKDASGRLVVDLMTVAVRCEQEGEEYLDAEWPAFDAENAKPFIGTWKAITYISGGEEIPAEMIGVMTFVLNDDGTAQSIEDGEEPYALRWYSDYSTAYLGDSPMALVQITFDGNGNLSVKMDEETTMIMARVEEIAETGTILGTWEDSSKTVEITEDGKLAMTYKSDGYINNMQWGMVGDLPTVTLGTWQDAPLVFADGKLIIDTNGLHYEFTRVGPVPDIYVGPGGFVVAEGDASAPFLGDWVEESGRGVLTFNSDFTAVMNYTDGTVYDFNWKTTDTGAIFTSGMWFDTAMVIENENTLNIADGWMILHRESAEAQAPAAQPIGPEGEPYFGTWTMDMGGIPMNLTLNPDGTCTMEIMGDAEMGVWTMENGKAYVMGDELAIDGDGNLVMVAEGMVFVRSDGSAAARGEMTEEEELMALLTVLGQMDEEGSGGEVGAPTAAGDDFYIGRKFLMTGAVISGVNLSASQLNAGNDYVIFNADGSVELFMGDRLVETLGWTRGPVTVVGQEYDGFTVDYYGTLYHFGITPYGLAFDYFGTLRTYEPEGGMPQEETPAPAETESPAAPSAPAARFSTFEDYMDIKFTAASYTSFGNTMDASTLGAEYSVTFHADGTCEFMMGGVNMPGLTWGLQKVAVGLNQVDAFVINYGMAYNFIPNGSGFDMDFAGTMNLHFIPAE